jgi:polysaccharide pyruvyl transferase WcaK-like protein
MLNSEGIQYFKKHQPIGCRDTYTQKTLEKHGIQTYFSACLTLTLKRANSVKSDKKRKGILVLSPLERLLPQEEINKQQGLKGQLLSIAQKLKQPFKSNKYSVAMNRLEAYLSQMDEEVLVKTQLMSPSTFSESDRIKAAQEQLECIASAKLVITSRIHSALPAVAYGTPVIFLADGLQHPNQKSRFEGMESFFKMITSEQLKTLEKNIPVPKKVPEVLLKRFEKELNTFLKD